MLLTTSRDSTFKVFLSSDIERRGEIKYNFDKTIDHITDMISIDNQHLVTKMNNLKLFSKFFKTNFSKFKIK